MYCERIGADDIICCDLSMTPTLSLLPSFVFYLFDDPEVSGFFHCFKNRTGY